MTVGIVGLGPHGTNHAELLQKMGHNVFGADANLDYCEKFEQELGVDTVTSPDGLYRRDLDAIIVSTPNKFHETAAVDAMENGFDVLIEKPLAHDLESAQRIASVAQKTENICMTGYSNRFLNTFQIAEEYVQSGYFGDISHINARHTRRRGIPGRGTWYTSQEIAGGGVLMDTGASLVSLLLSLLDWEEIKEIKSVTRSEFGNRSDYSYLSMWGEDDDGKLYDVEDSVVAFCEFENEISATIEVAWAANTESNHFYEIQGTEAGARLTMPNRYEDIRTETSSKTGLELYETRSEPVDHFIDSTLKVPANDPYEEELDTFLSAVDQNERAQTNDIDQALRIQRMLEQMYQAGGLYD